MRIDLDLNKLLTLGALSCFMFAATTHSPAPKHVVSMEYPPLARMARLQGTIFLTATVLHDGAVSTIRAEPGPEPLITPAKENLSKWRFENCSSSISECVAKVIFSFVLEGECAESPRCPTEVQVDLPDHVLVRSQFFGNPLMQTK